MKVLTFKKYSHLSKLVLRAEKEKKVEIIFPKEEIFSCQKLYQDLGNFRKFLYAKREIPLHKEHYHVMKNIRIERNGTHKVIIRRV
jgi:murein endopeptidase